MIVSVKIEPMLTTDGLPKGGAYLVTTLAGRNVDLDPMLVKVPFEAIGGISLISYAV